MSEPSRGVWSQVHAVRGLARERSWLGRYRRHAQILAHLDQITAAGAWQVAPRLLGLALHRDRRVAAAGATALTTLLRDLDPGLIPRLDLRIRERKDDWLEPEDAWDQMQPGVLHGALGLGAAEPVFLDLAMGHANGRVREAAIRRSGRGPFTAGFLLLRVNDWVPAVRHAAAEVLRARLRAGFASELVAVLPLLDAMPRWGRVDQRELLSEIEATLADPAAGPALLAGLASRWPNVRRGALRRTWANPAVDRQEAALAGLTDRVTANRLYLARLVCEQGDDALAAALLPRLETDYCGAIRRRALERRMRMPEGVSDAGLGQALVDRNDHVRRTAQVVAKARGWDLAALYRGRAAEHADGGVAPALAGLGETGDAEDATLCQRFLEHALPRVRAAALYAVTRLNREDAMATAMAALTDAAPQVTHTARDILLRHSLPPDPAALWAVFRAAPHAGARMDVLVLLERVDHWRRLPCLLRAIDAGPPPIANRARSAVTGWIGRKNLCFTEPTAADAAAIRQALAELRHVLPQDLAAEIEAVLDSRTPA